MLQENIGGGREEEGRDRGDSGKRRQLVQRLSSTGSQMCEESREAKVGS